VATRRRASGTEIPRGGPPKPPGGPSESTLQFISPPVDERAKSGKNGVKKRALARISEKNDRKGARFALPILTFDPGIVPHGPESTIRRSKRPDFGIPPKCRFPKVSMKRRRGGPGAPPRGMCATAETARGPQAGRRTRAFRARPGCVRRTRAFRARPGCVRRTRATPTGPSPAPVEAGRPEPEANRRGALTHASRRRIVEPSTTRPLA